MPSRLLLELPEEKKGATSAVVIPGWVSRIMSSSAARPNIRSLTDTPRLLLSLRLKGHLDVSCRQLPSYFTTFHTFKRSLSPYPWFHTTQVSIQPLSPASVP